MSCYEAAGPAAKPAALGAARSAPEPATAQPESGAAAVEATTREAQLAARVQELEATLADTRAALDRARGELTAQAEAHEVERARWERERARLLEGCESRVCSASRDLQQQVDAAGIMMVSVDRAGYITDMNKTAAELLGCDGKASAKVKLSDLLHPDDELSLEDLATTACHRAERAPGSVPVASRTGSSPGAPRQHQVQTRNASQPWQRFLIAAASARRPGGDEPNGNHVVYLGQDVSELHRENSEVRRAAEDLGRLFQTVNAPIIGIDQSGLVNRWNRKAELLTGFEEAEALGKDLAKTFVVGDYADTVQAMLKRSLQGQEITNYEFPVVTKAGPQREILWSGTARRDHNGELVGVIGVGQDITELRAETNMHANYIKICGAAVWSLQGQAATGTITKCRTKEIEHLISQQAEMDICDPRMVLWRASFVSILKTMCQQCWMSRRQAAGSSPAPGSGGAVPAPQSRFAATPSPQQAARAGSGAASVDFGYEFCFESPSGQVKWYKVEGHFLGDGSAPRDCGMFEVAGSMQEVTEMWIDKVMGDRRSSMWSRMCHMVFDATLLVDTQEYRVLNAWGEEKVFGCKLSSNHALVPLIKAEDFGSLKEAFNEVTFKGFERGRTLRLLRPSSTENGRAGETPAQCFLLAGDPENPNECMMGIRMQGQARGEAELWDVAKPNPVMTLEDLARLKSGLKRHRRPGPGNMRSRHMQNANRPSRSSDPVTSSLSLSSIPEDLYGESEDDDVRSISAGGVDTESFRSSSKSSKSSRSSKCSSGSLSGVGVCNSSPPRSASDEVLSLRSRELAVMHANLAASQRNVSSPTKGGTSPPPSRRLAPKVQRHGPPQVKLRWGREQFDMNLEDFPSIGSLRSHIQTLTAIPPGRQTLILAGRRLPLDDDCAREPTWFDLRSSVRMGQALMLIGSALKSVNNSVDKGPAASSGELAPAAPEGGLCVEFGPAVPGHDTFPAAAVYAEESGAFCAAAEEADAEAEEADAEAEAAGDGDDEGGGDDEGAGKAGDEGQQGGEEANGGSPVADGAEEGAQDGPVLGPAPAAAPALLPMSSPQAGGTPTLQPAEPQAALTLGPAEEQTQPQSSSAGAAAGAGDAGADGSAKEGGME